MKTRRLISIRADSRDSRFLFLIFAIPRRVPRVVVVQFFPHFSLANLGLLAVQSDQLGVVRLPPV
jgi:hypothetical protein